MGIHEVLARLGGVLSKSSVVVNLILGWLGIKGKNRSSKDRDAERQKMLRVAEQMAAGENAELELPESEEELNQALDKMSESFEAAEKSLFGLSPEGFATLVNSPEHKQQQETQRNTRQNTTSHKHTQINATNTTHSTITHKTNTKHQINIRYYHKTH